jgi:excisionase family DNA binding protein
VEGEESTGPLEAIQMADVGEAATALHVSKMTVYRLVWRGDLESHRVGRSIRIPHAAITAYLAAHRNGQGAA